MYTQADSETVPELRTKIDPMTKFTVHPCLLMYPRQVESRRTFVIDLLSTEPPFIVDNPVLVWAISSLPRQFSQKEALDLWSCELSVEEHAAEIWDFVSTEGIVVSLSDAESIQHRMKLWEAIAWDDAAVYHEGTRNYPFVDMSHKGAFLDDNKRMKDYEDSWQAPPVYQSFQCLDSVQLMKVDDDFASYLQDRKSAEAVKDLSLIFDFCFGERLRLEHAYDEANFLQLESLRKTIPSGGGRHPTEVFIASFDGSMGLEPGLFHYNVQHNKLDLLRKDVLFEEVQSLLYCPLSGAEGERPCAVLFFTSFCERAMWRYRDPRSWRAFVIDIGHAEYMCGQVLSAVGYSLSCCHKFRSEAAADFLNLDPLRQPVMSIGRLFRNTGV